MWKNIFIGILILGEFLFAYSQNSQTNLSEEEGLFQEVANIELHTTDGKVLLSDLYLKSPLIIVPVFSRCSGVCSPLLNQISEDLNQIPDKQKIQILVYSFDPNDQLSDVQNYAKRFGLSTKSNWIFATTPNINELNVSLGFYPVWDSVSQQFDHDAFLVGINQEGYIQKKMIGMRTASDLNLMVKSIQNEFIPSFPLPQKNQLISCFSYNPTTGERKLSLGIVILFLPAIFTILLLVFFATKKPMN